MMGLVVGFVAISLVALFAFDSLPLAGGLLACALTCYLWQVKRGDKS